MPSQSTQGAKLTILAAAVLLLGTGIFAGAAFSWRLPTWYQALFLGVAVAMVVSGAALVLRALLLERRVREIEQALAGYRASVEAGTAKPEPAELEAHPIAGRRADDR